MPFNSNKFNKIFNEEYYKVMTIVKIAQHFGFEDSRIEDILDYLETKSKNRKSFSQYELSKIKILTLIYEFNDKNINYLV